MKTYSAKPGEIERKWWVVDAEGKNLGPSRYTRSRSCSGARDKPQYTPHTDTGDFVVVVNADKVAVTGKKLTDKRYYRHSGRPGRAQEPHPGRDAANDARTRCCAWRSRACCPKNRLAAHQLTKLKIYAGPVHPHAAQKPEEMPWQE